MDDDYILIWNGEPFTASVGGIPVPHVTHPTRKFHHQRNKSSVDLNPARAWGGLDEHAGLAMIPPLFPKEPPTGYAHPKCYLRGTNDCCRKLSREHYISEAVLRTVRGGLQVSGGFWSGEKPKDITVETLVSKILCKRHNESLTSLDAAAGELFAAIAEVYDDFKAGSTSTGSRMQLEVM